ncbi:glutathione S-transferase 1 isoform X2 [Procambarus clarkii]|nr:glutathione S-transferase 1-like isoform X2 [Procambarus clarkii]XP_045612817.1 glutathione S-transferase 1-like isoform X2 [Procambarus clarkii]
MALDLYYTEHTAACRSVMLTAKAVGVELNMIKVDVIGKQQMKAELLAVNCQRCFPTLVDDDLVLWESPSICTYLATQYGKDDSLYPGNPKARATVDRLLYFVMGTLHHRFLHYVLPVLNEEKSDPVKLEALQEALTWLDDFLDGHSWAVGNSLTVADIVLVATVSTVEAAGIDVSSHDNVTAWMVQCKSALPGYSEVNEPGALEFGKWIKEKFESN